MNRIYKKNEVTFAIICIVIYVVGTSMCEALSESLGIVKLPSMIFHTVSGIILLVWLYRNGLFERYGLAGPAYPAVRAWFFIPLFLIGLSGVFFGVTLKYTVPETVFYIVSMLWVGFLEEIIFRGFLFFKGMARKNVKTAVAVSSVTFGIGHIVNLLNGQDLTETVFQIIFAVSVGFMLVTLFHKGGSLIPCIVFHGVNNACQTIGSDEAALRVFGSAERELFVSVTVSVILCVLYSIAMWKTLSDGKTAETA